MEKFQKGTEKEFSSFKVFLEVLKYSDLIYMRKHINQ